MSALLAFATELLPSLATVASTGMQIASMAGAFNKKSSSAPAKAAATTTDTAKETADAEEKKRRAYLASLGGRGSTVLSSGKGLIGGQVVEQGLKAQLGA